MAAEAKESESALSQQTRLVLQRLDKAFDTRGLPAYDVGFHSQEQQEQMHFALRTLNDKDKADFKQAQSRLPENQRVNGRFPTRFLAVRLNQGQRISLPRANLGDVLPVVPCAFKTCNVRQAARPAGEKTHCFLCPAHEKQHRQKLFSLLSSDVAPQFIKQGEGRLREILLGADRPPQRAMVPEQLNTCGGYIHLVPALQRILDRDPSKSDELWFKCVEALRNSLIVCKWFLNPIWEQAVELLQCLVDLAAEALPQIALSAAAFLLGTLDTLFTGFGIVLQFVRAAMPALMQQLAAPIPNILVGPVAAAAGGTALGYGLAAGLGGLVGVTMYHFYSQNKQQQQLLALQQQLIQQQQDFIHQQQVHQQNLMQQLAGLQNQANNHNEVIDINVANNALLAQLLPR